MVMVQIEGPGKVVSKDGLITIMGVRNGLNFLPGRVGMVVASTHDVAFDQSIKFLIKICGIDVTTSGNTKTIIQNDCLETLYRTVLACNSRQKLIINMLQRDEFFYYLNKYANIYFTGNDMSAEIQKSFSFMQREYADIIATIFYVMFNKEYKYGPKFLYNLQLTRKNEEHAAKSGTTEPAELTGLGKLFGPISEPSPVVSGKYAEVDVLKSINGQKRIIDGYRIWADVKST